MAFMHLPKTQLRHIMQPSVWIMIDIISAAFTLVLLSVCACMCVVIKGTLILSYMVYEILSYMMEGKLPECSGCQSIRPFTVVMHCDWLVLSANSY